MNGRVLLGAVMVVTLLLLIKGGQGGADDGDMAYEAPDLGHPRQKIWIPSIDDYSSAAGAFPIIRRTWDGVQGKLGLPDFSPASQDQACVELMRQRGGLRLAMNDEFAAAVPYLRAVPGGRGWCPAGAIREGARA